MPAALFDAVSIGRRGMMLSVLLMLFSLKVKAPSCGVRPSRIFLAISWIVAVSDMYSLTKEALEIPFAAIVPPAFCSDISCQSKRLFFGLVDRASGEVSEDVQVMTVENSLFFPGREVE